MRVKSLHTNFSCFPMFVLFIQQFWNQTRVEKIRLGQKNLPIVNGLIEQASIFIQCWKRLWFFWIWWSIHWTFFVKFEINGIKYFRPVIKMSRESKKDNLGSNTIFQKLKMHWKSGINSLFLKSYLWHRRNLSRWGFVCNRVS